MTWIVKSASGRYYQSLVKEIPRDKINFCLSKKDAFIFEYKDDAFAIQTAINNHQALWTEESKEDYFRIVKLKKKIMPPKNIDAELELIKDLFDIEFFPTIKGDEIKGYNKGKIYLDSTNCIELAEAFLKISRFLEPSNPNYDHQKGLEIDKERLFPCQK